MTLYKIQGGNPLCGEVKVSGAKNAVLPILSATLLTGGITKLSNCPDLSDVRTTLDILNTLGCRTSFEGNTIMVDSSSAACTCVPKALAEKCRSSITFLGPLLGRFGEAVIPHPGGCAAPCRRYGACRRVPVPRLKFCVFGLFGNIQQNPHACHHNRQRRSSVAEKRQ